MNKTIAVGVWVLVGGSMTIGVGGGVRVNTLPVAKAAAQETLVNCRGERQCERSGRGIEKQGSEVKEVRGARK